MEVNNIYWRCWSWIFAETFSIAFKVCVRTDRGERGSAKCGQVWTGGERESKITENVRTSFMDGPNA